MPEGGEDKPDPIARYLAAGGDNVKLVYALYLASFVVGVTMLVGLVLAYINRGQASGTWMESHYTYQIRTFWIGILYSCISFVLMVVLIGFLLIIVVAVWSIARCVRGLIGRRKASPSPPQGPGRSEHRNAKTKERGTLSYSVFAFDAYGTLFDVHAAVRRHAAALGPDAARFSETWRAKQLEYSWVRSLAGRYRDFWTLTEEALDFCFAAFPSADRALRASSSKPIASSTATAKCRS